MRPCAVERAFSMRAWYGGTVAARSSEGEGPRRLHRSGSGVEWPAMWAIYWQRFPFVQALFIAICAVLRWYFGRPWVMVAVVFAILQPMAVMAAWWGSRIMQEQRQK